jgi:hypothetical protein
MEVKTPEPLSFVHKSVSTLTKITYIINKKRANHKAVAHIAWLKEPLG